MGDGGGDLERQRAQCMRLLAHDLNNPLTAIRILSEMLRDELRDEEMRRDVIDVLEAADLAGAIIDGMASMLRLDGEEEEYTWFPIDLVQVIRGAVDRPALRTHVKLKLPHEIQMGGDRRALRRAFTDLLVNARRLVEAPHMVEISAHETAKGVEITIFHPGLGVPAALRESLFERFGAVDLRQKRIPVAAVGLRYAQHVVHKHGGTIQLEDAPDSTGMIAQVTLPR